MKKMWKYASVGMLVLSMMFTLAGCNNGKTQGSENASQIAEAIQTTPIATMTVKDYGTVTLELYPDMAPNTVNNFIALANDGFYDGLTFHRVIPSFMIQGGDPDGIGSGGPGYSIAGEFAENGFKENTLSHTKGVISMARTNRPNTAGSQFFIMSADNPQLDGKYAAFGKVTSGIEVVEAIENVKTNSSDKPETDVVIESIRVDTNGVEVPEVIKIEG